MHLLESQSLFQRRKSSEKGSSSIRKSSIVMLTMACLALLVIVIVIVMSYLRNTGTQTSGNHKKILDESNQVSSSMHQSRLIKPIPEVVLEVLGYITGIMEIYESISTSIWGTDEAAHLNEQFEKSSYQLEQINEKLNEMMAQINVGFIKTNLIDDVKIIQDCSFSVRNYFDCLNKTSSDCEEQKRTFFSNVEGSTSNQLENSIRHIMESMAGSFPITDIPGTYRLALDNYENKLEEQLNLWMGWINTGIYVHGAYVKTKNIHEKSNRFFRSYLNTTYNVDIVKKREDEGLLCRNESKVPQEIQQVLQESKALNNSETVKALYKKLSDKYRTKRWFAIVYKDMVGNSNHNIEDIFPNSFHESGKNAFAYSFEANHPNISTDDWDFLMKYANDERNINYKDAASSWNFLNNGTGQRLHLAVITTYNVVSDPQAYWGQDDLVQPFDLKPYYDHYKYFKVVGLPNSTSTSYLVNYNETNLI